MKRVLFVLPVLGFFVLLAVFFAGLGRDPRALPSAFVGKPLPAFTTAPLRPDDVGLANTDLAGRGEPALLNVFASWCGPCRVEHPVLMRLRAEGVAIHGLDWKEAPADGARWLAERGDPYIRAGNDPTGRTGIEFGVAGVPETFVIDKRGRVRYRHVGALTPDDWERKIGPLMEQLRKES
jgi:cytochrome c biogenesis protein CcmG, thiol:disulfide interchange protein DsbE